MPASSALSLMLAVGSQSTRDFVLSGDFLFQFWLYLYSLSVNSVNFYLLPSRCSSPFCCHHVKVYNMMMMLGGPVMYIIYSDDKLFCCITIFLFLLLVLYVQQCSRLTGTAQYDVYKCSMKSMGC